MNSKLVYSTDDSVNFNDEITESIKIKPSDHTPIECEVN